MAIENNCHAYSTPKSRRNFLYKSMAWTPQFMWGPLRLNPSGHVISFYAWHFPLSWLKKNLSATLVIHPLSPPVWSRVMWHLWQTSVTPGHVSIWLGSHDASASPSLLVRVILRRCWGWVCPNPPGCSTFFSNPRVGKLLCHFGLENGQMGQVNWFIITFSI